MRAFGVAVILAGALAGPAAAQPRSAPNCMVVSADTLDFGVYNFLLTTPTMATVGITVRCSDSDPNVRVVISAGNSGVFAQRVLDRGGGATVKYNVYADAAATKIAGDGSAGTTPLGPPTVPGINVTFTLYGQIPPGQVAPAGSYTDNLRATLVF